ncbi:MAG: multidrug transporter AcrB [Rhodospirillaceae bacterium]|nr:multidrug transporter AcrB [Rhodospirillaceae bacterium]
MIKAIIEWMTRHGVAPNLLMFFMIASGIYNAFIIPVEVFPEIKLNTISVSVEYLGASPREIEESILQRIEEQIEGIDGIQDITSTAIENKGSVLIELATDEDASEKLDEIKAEINQINSFPAGAERPEVRETSNRKRVVEIAVLGNIGERNLKELANKIKDDLVLKNAISLAEVSGTRDYEISIEVPNSNLRSYNLSLPKISEIVGRESLDLPSGKIESKNEDIVLRTLGRNYERLDFEDIVILSGSNGAQVKLSDISNVRDGFREQGLISSFNGEPAVFVKIYRTGDEQVLAVVNAVDKYIQTELTPALPTGASIKIWRNDAEELTSRLNLLLKNGAIGLILVIVTLTLFLDIRLALWTSLGILVAFIAAIGVLNLLDNTINQIALFGFILAIGIVVDDAIVISENIYSANEAGLSPLEAAINGAQRVSIPVFFAVATTIVAFSPLLFVPGVSGKFLGQMPVIVIILLLLSLLEAMLILPYHLSHINLDKPKSQNKLLGYITNIQKYFSKNLEKFVNGPLSKALHFVTLRPWVIVSAASALILLSFGLVKGGYVKVQFFPIVEGRYITATIELKTGTPLDRTKEIADEILRIGKKVERSFNSRLEENDPPLVKSVYILVGSQDFAAPPVGQTNMLPDSNKASVVMELVKPETRSVSVDEFQDAWRSAVGTLPNVSRLFFSSQLFNLGEPVQVEVSASSKQELNYAIDQIQQRLSSVSGVFDIRNDRDEGKREVQLQLRPQARVYGISLQDLAVQIRAAFFGSEAVRVQRGSEEIRVYVRLPKNERNSILGLRNYRVQVPGFGFVPLQAVATITEGISPSAIKRRNGRSIVSITANVDDSKITGQEVSSLLENSILPKISEQVSGLRYSFGGEQREQSRTLPKLFSNFILSLFVIYALLAIAFKSYIQPLIIMAAIPFGTIGAILGHLILGLNLTLPGIFGIVGLAGVIVNGALVMIDFINEEKSQGKPIREAIISGTKSRFRPIMLTALTTFLGVLPLIIEKSIQAQFLVPVACSIGFGVLFGTAVQLLLVPALISIHEKAYNESIV